MKTPPLDKRIPAEPCFMLANWYSGATLLAILLNNHRNISCNGEVPPFKNNNVDDLVCSCNEKLNECLHYKNVGEGLMIPNTNTWDRRIFQTLPDISQVNLINKYLTQFSYTPIIRDSIIKYFPLFYSRVNYFMEKQKIFIDNTLQYDKTSIYIDGTKSIRRAEMFIKYSDTTKLIHLIRDGRGFCSSYIKNQPKPGNTLDIASRQWNDYIRLVDKLSQRYPKINILTVKYENLCANIEVTLNKICDFIDLPHDQNILDFNHKQYHILGNRMKGKFDGIVKEDLSWKSKLNEDQVNKITRMMFKNMKRFNYI